MKEQPNFTYLEQLSGGDKDFRNKLIGVVKEEFPDERELYLENMERDNLASAGSNVHKLKHKMSILGLEKSYRFSERYEDELRENNPENHGKYLEILNHMSDIIDKL